MIHIVLLGYSLDTDVFNYYNKKSQNKS